MRAGQLTKDIPETAADQRVRLQGVGGNPGQFVLHTKALHGNPFDGHTLEPMVAELEALTGIETHRIHVDKGYRGRTMRRNSASGSPAKCAVPLLRSDARWVGAPRSRRSLGI